MSCKNFIQKITGASIEGTAKHSAQCVKQSDQTQTYRFPLAVFGRGPRILQAMHSKASCTGMGRSGTLWRLRGVFRIAQSQQLRHQCCMPLATCHMPHVVPIVASSQRLISFNCTKVTCSRIIMCPCEYFIA